MAFASGADISEFKEQRKDTASALALQRADLARPTPTIRECPKPTVAMIFGFCMGGAMAVAMACDLRFAAEGSKFGIPAARLSIIYGADSGRPARRPRRPGLREGHPVLGADGRRPGSARHGLHPAPACPPAELEAYTYDYLRKVADNAPLSVRGAKATIESYLPGLTDERRREAHATWPSRRRRARTTEEGTRAFLEKRAPRFQGR